MKTFCFFSSLVLYCSKFKLDAQAGKTSEITNSNASVAILSLFIRAFFFCRKDRKHHLKNLSHGGGGIFFCTWCQIC